MITIEWNNKTKRWWIEINFTEHGYNLVTMERDTHIEALAEVQTWLNNNLPV